MGREVAIQLAYDPADQKRRRRRARVTLADLATRLGCSTASLSLYENGKEPLPWGLDSDDYERALAAALLEKAGE